MIVTTAGRTNDQMVMFAEQIAHDLKATFIPRHKRSINAIQHEWKKDVLVVGKDRLEYYPIHASQPFFFHPNSAMFRVKRLMKGEKDPFIEAAALSAGMSLLDCTVGLASDSITASFVVGRNGKVIGIEKSSIISYLVQKGLQRWETQVDEVNEAMRKISIIQGDHYAYLQSMPSKSFDVVYFDPMFEETIEAANGIDPLRDIASYGRLSTEVIEEAKRVARSRVVLKDHFRSERFSTLHFKQIHRKTATFHFGVIELGE
ncbi:class I SAM-dependent methyltransferase [Bacillus sp. FJAT-47783]|uniref:class I SAM-dependent methyltransferase n=1 Tax=Bacillus sp. FJAT-47783 TaxID=2922712 RepID=UPI001FAC67E1|nr:class I SAM-dependent methyltransferase [Bacillus sp. FJAT-47783]